MLGAQVRLWQVGQMMPRQLGRHMEMHGALPVLFVSSWLLTAFAADFPLSFTARIMDAILADSYVEPVMKVRLHQPSAKELSCSEAYCVVCDCRLCMAPAQS